MGQKRTTKRKGLKRKPPKDSYLLNLLSKVVRGLADYKCEFGVVAHKYTDGFHPICLQTSKYRTECHHGAEKTRFVRTRYEVDNCVSLCKECHAFLQTHDKINTRFFTDRIGSKRMDELEVMAHSHYPVDKKELLNKLKDMLETISD